MKPIDLKFLRETVDTTDMLVKHPLVAKFALVGSAIYHPEPKDLDFLVLVNCAGFWTAGDGEDDQDLFDQTPAGRWAFGPEWDCPAGQYDVKDDTWGAIRRGNVNLIITTDAAWFERAKLANEVCAALKLMDKPDRIKVYRVVRDGYTAEAAQAAA